MILLSAISMPFAPGKVAFQTRVIHTIQKSDFIYWGFTRLFQSLFLQLIGIPPDVYRGFTPEQKELAQEMLEVMHPMSQRIAGTMHEFEIEPLDGASIGEICVPTLIMHARDDTLVSYKHAEFAHRNIPQSKLVLFDSGGHGLISRMNEARVHASTYLNERIPSAEK